MQKDNARENAIDPAFGYLSAIVGAIVGAIIAQVIAALIGGLVIGDMMRSRMEEEYGWLIRLYPWGMLLGTIVGALSGWFIWKRRHQSRPD